MDLCWDSTQDLGRSSNAVMPFTQAWGKDELDGGGIPFWVVGWAHSGTRGPSARLSVLATALALGSHTLLLLFLPSLACHPSLRRHLATETALLVDDCCSLLPEAWAEQGT